MDTKIDRVKIIEDEIIPIHPALDFMRDLAIITIPLPTQRLVGDKNKNIDLSVQQEYWVVTDKKDFFPLDTKELLDRNFYPTGTCYVMTNRWNYKDSLKLWLKDSVDIDPEELFLGIKAIYEFYLDYIDPRLYTFNALWVIGTYFFPLFNAYPIVFLNGGSGSGKSKTIDVTEQLAFNAINTANISDASIYRIIQGTRATLLLDENEKIADSEEAKTLINLVLAGFKKGAKVIRLEKGKHQDFIPTKFEVHCPKMIANIKGIHEEALKNRCIPFIMTPTQSDKSNNYPTGEEPEWQNIRNSLYIFTMNRWREIGYVKKDIVASKLGLNGYAFMLWQPILTIAKYLERFVGSRLLDEMASLATEKTTERKTELMENYDRQLLRTIRDMVQGDVSGIEGDGNKFFSSNLIYENFKYALGFAEDKLPNWFTPQRVGRMVNSLDVGKHKTEMIDSRQTRGFWIDKERLNRVLGRFGIVDVC
ncbi:MAG: hypothetical protein FJZ16_08295 [Candidatus Omnitrophica bacterium]|nr:hypothetical protein [Candidatus Omnitrophota bacterium]